MTYRAIRPEGVETTHNQPFRNLSISSDVLSSPARSVVGGLPHATPDAAYVAENAASHLVSTELERNVVVASSALELVNKFLDQQLYNILSQARSTALGPLRAAVPIVLRPRLGNAAMRAAEVDLKDYLTDKEMKELLAGEAVADPKSDFRVELAWKLARLRCMVYARLGDMEEEDEEEFLEEEGLQPYLDNPAALIAPESAIFLTAVLEFLGEQALYVAGQYAERRHLTAHTANNNEDEFQTRDDSDIMLDANDMIQVGREGPLSRLWRSWRHDARPSDRMSPRDKSPILRGSSSFDSQFHSRDNSIASPIKSIDEEISQNTGGQTRELVSPSLIPLPIRDNDIDEIEVPGLAPVIYDDDEERLSTIDQTEEGFLPRPRSAQMMPGSFPSPVISDEEETNGQYTNRPYFGRTRSRSLPPPVPFRFGFTSQQNKQVPVGTTESREVEKSPKPAFESIHERQETPTATQPTPEMTEEENAYHEKQSEDPNLRSDLPLEDHVEGQESAPVEGTKGSKNSALKASVMSGTVAAIAGAIAVEARKKPNKGKGTATMSDEDLPAGPSKRQRKTVAEELLGPSNTVPRPTDAATGSSITGATDFDSMHVPAHTPIEDTEDLPNPRDQPHHPQEEVIHAITTDEVEQPQHHMGLRDSGFSVTAPVIGEEIAEQNHADHGQAGSLATPPQMTSFLRDSVDSLASGPHGIATIHQTETHSTRGGSFSQDRDATQMTGIPPPTGTQMLTSSAMQPAFVQGGFSSSEQQRAKHSPSDSRSSTYSHQSKSSSSSSRLLGFTRDSQGRPQPLSEQRAELPSSPKIPAPGHSRNGSIGKDARPGTGHSTVARQQMRLRSDSNEPTGALTRAEAREAKKKSLEILINSDETLHYTLTPESARADVTEVSHILNWSDLCFNLSKFPKPPVKAKSQTQELADFFKNTSPPGDPIRPNTSRSARDFSGSRKPTSPLTASKKVIPSSANIPQSVQTSDKPRNRLGEPRSPRMDHNPTTRDLADYARSTGPADPTQLPVALNTRPGTTASNRTAPAAMRADGFSGATFSKPSTDSNRPATSKPGNRLKYQARDARPANTESADLIDFIREGPPRATGEHRIDRHVAPFRRTMDSDDFNNLQPPHDRDINGRNSVGSAQESTVTAKSMVSSLNSRTGLLDSTNRAAARAVNGNSSAGSGFTPQPAIPESDGIPKRNRRKVRDPYAIDYSDDELDEDLFQPPPRAQEESLIDFLRNTAPTPSMTTQPILAVGGLRSQEPQPVKRSPSASKLRDILMPTSGSSRPATSKTITNAREESPHLTQAGSKIDRYRPTQATHAAHVDRNRQKSRSEPRDATRSNGTTADLAEYFRNTGPITMPSQRYEHTTAPEPRHDPAGFSKLFTRIGSLRK